MYYIENSNKPCSILLIAVNKKRQEMINLGNTYGLTDNRTIRCSQQLDKLLNITKNTSCHDFELTG